jgi:glycosyltransferase involved in cell wall biosynthesis
MQKLLIIGTVWPEPTSSAAGTRMMQLIDAFKRFSYEITFASTASSGPFSVGLQEINVHPVSIQLNHSSFDDFIKALQPNVVLFDRFMIEEQFGWRVAEHCPNALRILDTEDLHCLRFARTQALKQNRTYTTLDLNNDLAVREIAAIYRCDLSLIISEYEIELLNTHFKIDASLLIYVPFLFDVLNDDTISKLPTFDERHHFITIGNFLHEPNRKSVLYLKEHLWPLIKKQLPQTELHVYGAYPTPQILQLHQPKNGFLIKGRAEDAVVVMEQAKVLLAPLQIGAGLKGKLAEAMLCGTPSVTTRIGAEGMFDTEDWCGFVADDVIVYQSTTMGS